MPITSLLTVGVPTLAALTGWLIWGNVSLQTSHFSVFSSRLPSTFDGFRIVHISDLHNAVFGKHNQKLLARIKRAKPDIIAITGDLINSYRHDLEIALDFAQKVVQIAPCYYVTGNHESRISAYPQLKQGLIAAGVSVLANDVAEISHNGQTIQIVGITDPSFIKAADPKIRSRAIVSDALMPLLSQDSEQYTLLLAHRPDLFETYASFGVDLVLSGHAHGGQFRLPFIGSIFAPNQGFFPKYAFGLHHIGNAQMVVSRGLGNSSFPIRFCNRPEIPVLELHVRNND